MGDRRLTFADRKRLRDEAIVDLRHGFINRREFMLRATAARRLRGICLARSPAPSRLPLL